MSKAKPPLEPVKDATTPEEREARARSFMATMADYANRGILAHDTLLWLQRSSQACLDAGLPDLVLAPVGDGTWRVLDRGAPGPIMPEPVTKNPDVTKPVTKPTLDVTKHVTKPADVTKPDGDVTKPRGGRPTASGARAMTAAERKRASRARKRAKERGE